MGVWTDNLIRFPVLRNKCGLFLLLISKKVKRLKNKSFCYLILLSLDFSGLMGVSPFSDVNFHILP